MEIALFLPLVHFSFDLNIKADVFIITTFASEIGYGTKEPPLLLVLALLLDLSSAGGVP